MKTYFKEEIWKEYPLNFEFEGNQRIEVSDRGNIKSYSLLFPEGNMVNGCTQGGYRIFRTKMRRKWDDKDLKKIEEINNEISLLNIEIKNLIAGKQPQEIVTKLRTNRDKLIQKRKKLNTKLTNKYNINLALLFHKAVAELFLDSPKNKAQKFVIHKDFDKTNNAVENLQWASQADLDARFKKHPKMILHEFNKQFVDQKPQIKNSKLSEMEVLRIKTRLKKGDRLNQLAKQFNVSDMQIHRIKTGENWSHVKLIEELVEENESKRK